jgi:hypothetical protein
MMPLAAAAVVQIILLKKRRKGGQIELKNKTGSLAKSFYGQILNQILNTPVLKH